MQTKSKSTKNVNPVVLWLLSPRVSKIELDGLWVDRTNKQTAMKFHLVEPQTATILLKTESKHTL